MKPRPLRFTEIQVRRAPGFESEGFTLRHLSSGINLIHGSNGAGKSTTGRAVARLLWPGLREGGRVWLRGRFDLEVEEWTVEVDGSRVLYERNGIAAQAPLLPPGDGHHRYHLALHDLLRERDVGFAAAVARESAGGYDLRRSGKLLDPRAPISRRQPLNDALDQARAEYDRAVALQRELRAEERELAGLEQAFQAADRGLLRVAVLEVALEHARAAEAESLARLARSRFPEGMERVGGDEYERLCRLRDRMRELEKERGEAEEVARGARLRIQALDLPEESLREELLRGLENDLERIRAADQELTRARGAYSEALAKLEIESKRLGGSVDADRLADAGLEAIAGVGSFARRAQAAAARRGGIEAQLRLLQGAGTEDDPRRLEEGIRLLRCWLREPVPVTPTVDVARASAVSGMVAAALLIVAGVLLAAVADPLYLVLVLVGGGLLWPMLRHVRAGAAVPDSRAVHRREYEKLALDRPETWEPAAVETLLDRLQDRAVAARDAALRARRMRELEEELAAVAEEQRRMEREGGAIAARLGVGADIGLTEMVWIAEAVGRWQAAQTAVKGEEGGLRAAERRVEELTESLRSRLRPLGYAALPTLGALAAAIQALRGRRHDLETERERLRSAAASLGRLERERTTLEREIQALFDGLGLPAGSDPTVREWCEGRAEYRRAYEAHRRAESVLGAARVRLDRTEGGSALAGLPVHELEAELVAERERASPRDELSRRITATQTRLKEARRSHSIEEALARVERAQEALRRARDRDVRAAIAQVLIDSFERATRDQHLPGVFRRARELFSRITHGRYELRLRQEGEPEFTAFDQIDRTDRRLEELSSGTRVQLLLSVRVAFVEQQEQGVKLPLVLDEVLGNSDDERARAIMEAVVELARDGRQIFYFTAQADEVGRWRALATAGELEGIELREIDLNEVRGWERRVEIPSVIPTLRRRLPNPLGADYTTYGRQLRVPGLDRAVAESGAVHLWYLLDEPESLHRLLLLGPDRWGPLRALLHDGGRPLVKERELAELEACGRVAEAFLEAARVGTGRRVDRAVLEESGAVSRTFLDRVDRLAAELGGDGVRLLQALEAGAVPRFTRRSKERLRAYLEAGGYLPQEPPLALGEIRTRVLSRVAPDLAGGVIGIDRIDRILGRLWVGINNNPPPLAAATPAPQVQEW